MTQGEVIKYGLDLCKQEIGIDGSIFIPKLVSTAYINAKIDFESRTCESCKYYDDIYCTNQKVDEMMDEFQQLDNYIRVDKGFGCNKHEAILSYE